MISKDAEHLIRTLPEACFVVSTAGEIITVNPAAAKLLARDMAFLSGQRLADLVSTPPDQALRYLHVCSRNREPVPGTLSWRIGNEAVVECLCRGNLFRPGMSEAPPLVFMRCETKTAAGNKFTALNRKLEELNEAYHHLLTQSEAFKAEISERQRVESKLRESEEKYRFLFENSRDALVTVEPPAWKFSSGNPAAVAMFRAKSEADFLSYMPWDLSPERQPDGLASVEKAKAIIETAVREGSHSFEWVHRRIDGEEFFADILLTRIKRRGKVMIQATIRDITERTRNEEIIRKLSSAVEQSPATVMITDTHGIIEYVNPAFAQIAGYSAEEAIGKNPRFLQSGETPREEYGRLWATLKAGQAWQGEFCNKKKSGELYWEHAAIAPITDAAGNTTHYVAIKEDITERKRAEELLLESEAKLRVILETVQTGIVIIDAETHTIVEINPTAAAMIGETREQLLGSVCHRHICPADRGKCPITDLKMTVDNSERVLLKADGTRLAIIKTVTTVPLGGRLCLIESFVDISKRKEAEDALRQSEDRLNAAQRIAHVGCWELDLTTNALVWSDEIYRIFEIDPSAFGASYEAFLNAIHPDDREKVNAAYADSLTSRTPYAIEYRLLLPDGKIKHVHEQCETFYDADGKPLRSVGTVQDITERKQIEENLKSAQDRLVKSEKKLQDITSSLGEGVYVTDEYGKVIFMNPEAELLLGLTLEELAGKNIHDVIHCRKPDNTPLLFADCPMHNVLLTGERYISHEEIFIRKDGASFPVSIISAPICENGNVVAVVTSFSDITDLKKIQDELNRSNKLLELQATIDSLTGIFNRRKFEESMIKELSRARRNDLPLSLVMFDIDHFKHLNDTFGHHTGDVLLQKLAANVARHTRKHDYFARWGGDEFMILLPHTTRDRAAQFAEHCRAQIEGLEIGGLEEVTCSFGVTELQADDDIFSFAKRADTALYRAKKGGRNRVETL